MQTFLPFEDFTEVAQVLDNKRLNKQALEAWQIMMTNLQLDPQGNHRVPKGWYNHPATKMWRGYETTLYTYIEAMVTEWKRRGYKSTILDKASATLKVAFDKGLITHITAVPEWMEDSMFFERIAESHRKALLVKDYEWYSQFDWAEDAGYPESEYEYVWADSNE